MVRRTPRAPVPGLRGETEFRSWSRSAGWAHDGMEARGTMTTPTILQACDDPELFGFELWPRQRELLAALEAGPRIAVWALGRRASKTTMAALAALHNCLFRPDLDAMVRRGETRIRRRGGHQPKPSPTLRELGSLGGGAVAAAGPADRWFE